MQSQRVVGLTEASLNRFSPTGIKESMELHCIIKNKTELECI